MARDARARLGAAIEVATVPLAAKAAVIAAVGAGAFLLCALLLAALVGISAGSAAAMCGRSFDAAAVPAELIPIYERASRRYRLGPRGVAILAAINKIETGFGRSQGPSSAGALGWMQFMPATWAAYGVDADRDGSKDPSDPDDAIHAAARYLHASGAPVDWHRAVFAYNHAEWYVQQVLAQAERYSGGTAPAAGGEAICEPADVKGVKKVAGGGAFVPIPGFPGERIDRRLLQDIAYLKRRYRIFVTDAYAPTGHTLDGEHPIGLAADVVPGPGGSWRDIDELAGWAEPEPGKPRPPWRWVGYNGDPSHGNPQHCSGSCPAHLHLSWQHSEPTIAGRPADWVLVLDLDEQPGSHTAARTLIAASRRGRGVADHFIPTASIEDGGLPPHDSRQTAEDSRQHTGSVAIHRRPRLRPPSAPVGPRAQWSRPAGAETGATAAHRARPSGAGGTDELP